MRFFCSAGAGFSLGGFLLLAFPAARTLEGAHLAVCRRVVGMGYVRVARRRRCDDGLFLHASLGGIHILVCSDRLRRRSFFGHGLGRRHGFRRHNRLGRRSHIFHPHGHGAQQLSGRLDGHGAQRLFIHFRTRRLRHVLTHLNGHGSWQLRIPWNGDGAQYLFLSLNSFDLRRLVFSFCEDGFQRLFVCLGQNGTQRLFILLDRDGLRQLFVCLDQNGLYRLDLGGDGHGVQRFVICRNRLRLQKRLGGLLRLDATKCGKRLPDRTARSEPAGALAADLALLTHLKHRLGRGRVDGHGRIRGAVFTATALASFGGHGHGTQRGAAGSFYLGTIG